jgi:hypothetical protein
MPHVLIETRRQYSEAQETALMDAVHGALRRAFQIPPDDRHVRLLAHAPQRVTCRLQCRKQLHMHLRERG